MDRRFIAIVVGLLALMLCAGMASAQTTKWVDQLGGGLDTNDGNTEATAYATLQKAIDNSVSGIVGTPSLIHVKDGTYETAGQTNQGGSTTAILIQNLDHLTIQAVAGHNPKVMPNTAVPAYIVSISIENCDHLIIDNIDSDQTVALFDNWHVWDSDDLTVRNSTFEGGEDGIDFNTGFAAGLFEGNTFQNITSGSGDEALDFTDGVCTAVIIQDNHFDFNYRHMTLGAGAYSGFTIRRNILDGTNSEEAIRLIGTSGVLVENNVIMNNLQQGIYVDTGCSDITIQHNTFFNNDQEAGPNGELRIKPDPTTANITVKNNIIYGNGSNPPFESVIAGWAGEDYNLIYNDDGSFDSLAGSNTIIGADPHFVSTTAGSEDLDLQDSSIAIGAGASLGVLTDIDGNTRGTPPDIGAYENAFDVPQVSTVYVDPSYCDGCANDGHIWGYDAFNTIQGGINAVTGSTVFVAAGTYNERPVVNKSVTITGADEATVIIDAGVGATGGSYGFTVTADNVTITDLTLVGDTSLSTPRYGFKISSVSNFTLTNVTAKEFYRTGVDLLGVTNGVLTDVTSIDNDGHGFSVLDCNNVTLTNTTMSGNAWQGVSVVTWGRYSPLGTSGIVFAGTNSFVDAFQLEMGDYNNPGVPPAGAAIITYSTNPADLADVTVLSSDYGFAVHGEQDDSPDQVRIWFADTFANASLLPAYAPIGHFTGDGMFIESLTDATQLYVTPGCSIQAAIDAADDYDTVNVSAGTYVEALLIEKPISVLGATAGINKNGYTVPAGYAWDDTVESIIKHPTPTSVYEAIVDIYDTDDVIFKGFVVEELSAVGNLNRSLVRAYAYSSAIEGIVVENNIIGPNTNTVSQDGTHGRMGLYLVNYPYSDQGIKNSSFSHNKIFDMKGNGNNIFLWSSYYAYGAPGPASMAGTVIDDNEIYGSHRSGIETAGGFADLVISNNEIYGNSGLPGDTVAALKYGHGILLIRGSSDKVSDPLTAYGPVDLVITGNDIHDNEKSGVYTGPKNDGIYITENLIHDNGWNGVMVDLAGNYWNPQFESPPSSGDYACYDCSQDVFANDNSLWGNGGAAVVASDYGVAVNGTPTNSFILDASWNWWGAASGPTHPTANPGGTGEKVTDYVDIDPYRTGNIVCNPDPLDLVDGSTTGSIDVDYLGGGGGLVYGYSVTVTWDITKATLTGITQGNLLSDAGGTNFFAYGPAGSKTIDCALTGGAAGVTGPGTLFTLAFSAAGLGTSTVVLNPVAFRDNANVPLSGFYVDDGVINVDTTTPAFTDVSLWNLTLSHTDDYAKSGDNLKLTANVTDTPLLTALDIVADFSTLLVGGVAGVPADSYDGAVATWTTALAGVTLTADGSPSVTVTATDWLGNSASGSDAIIVDNTVPGTVAGLAAAPAHEEVVLSWDNASGEDTNYYGVMVRYGVWSDYPLYDLPDPAPYPGDYTAGALAFSGIGTGTTFGVVPRDIYYFSAFVYDWALNYGTVTTAGQDRATNYWLGDVANVANNWVPDGAVTVADITKLSTLYGSAPAGDELKCDVGPTDDHSRVGIPEPDDMLNFEDLMIFAMNYGVVAAKVVPFLGEPVVGDLALALVENGRSEGMVELALRLEGNLGDVKGLTAELEFEGLEFLSARLSDEMSSPLADVFFWSNAASHGVQVDAAVLGTDVTIGGSGDVAVLTFQVLDDTYSVDFVSAQLRGIANEDLTAELEGLSSDLVPVAFKLVQNSPNPFNPVTKVAYHVPSESSVTIRVFDVTGRLVTTLVDGVIEAGRHAAVWNGTNDRGESVGSGVYFCTMETPDYSSSHKMTLLK